MSKKGVFIALLATLGLLLSGATAERKGDKIVLSSNRMLVEIDLTRGGRVSKLFDKKIQKDLAVLDNAPGGSGIFADSIYKDKVFSSIKKIKASDDPEQSLRKLGGISTLGFLLAIAAVEFLPELIAIFLM